MSVQAAQTYGVHMDAVDHLPTGAAIGFGVVRHIAQAGGLARLGDAVRGVDGGAGRCIHLVRMMQFDDLGGFEVFGGLGGEIVGEHRGDGEVRRDEHLLCVGARTVRDGLAYLSELLIGPTGGTDHDIHALCDQREHVAQADGRHGEFHDHIGISRFDARKIVARIERERQLHVFRTVHRVDHMRAHTSFGTYDRNLNHVVSLPMRRAGTCTWKVPARIPVIMRMRPRLAAFADDGPAEQCERNRAQHEDPWQHKAGIRRGMVEHDAGDHGTEGRAHGARGGNP